MEIQELKVQIENCQRFKDGRLKLSVEMKSVILKTFNESGLGAEAFAEATGLSSVTVYKLRKRAGQEFKPKLKSLKVDSGFKTISITGAKAKFQVTGPSGMRVEFESVDQVANLWRALC